jgi:hypothetical protein
MRKEPGTLMSETFVKNAVIRWLSRNGWGTNLEFDELHAHGVDIRVRNNRYSRYFLIEAKGEGKNRSGSEVAFVYSLGQIITRMKDGGSTRNYYGLALPAKSAQIALRRVPWQVSKKLQLYIFSVNADGNVERYSWQDIKLKQLGKA